MSRFVSYVLALFSMIVDNKYKAFNFYGYSSLETLEIIHERIFSNNLHSAVTSKVNCHSKSRLHRHVNLHCSKTQLIKLEENNMFLLTLLISIPTLAIILLTSYHNINSVNYGSNVINNSIQTTDYKGNVNFADTNILFLGNLSNLILSNIDTQQNANIKYCDKEIKQIEIIHERIFSNNLHSAVTSKVNCHSKSRLHRHVNLHCSKTQLIKLEGKPCASSAQ
ncbi:hypothetical protein GJ496_011430 [Pomphorhynchus laevis]|nr:hypothetical protein GJ496_011430 [Pomphorhynchus laevis]